ncbi:MAG TPA: sulfite exporter TauE/SafE family protein [Longimicrobium sp.]|nr:sulfite exporter TauE/SafE family protein [Longimicrobium sp.]
MAVAGLLIAAVIGLSLGLLGGGGSILTVPVFVYVLGFGAKQAIAMSLAVVGATSLAGALGHWRAGNVRPRVALVFGALAMVGAYAGARLSVYFSGNAQLLLFAAVMLIAAAFMFRGRGAEAPLPTGGADRRRVPLARMMVPGVAVGVVTGLLGVGGGFMIVPALVLLARVPMKQAVGTSLLIIAMNSAAGFAAYLGRVRIDWEWIGAFTLVAICGVAAGTHLVRYVSQERLRRGFAAFLVAMAGFILYHNRAALLPGSVAQAAAPGASASP